MALNVGLCVIVACLAGCRGCRQPNRTPPTAKSPSPANPGLAGFPDTPGGHAAASAARAARQVGPGAGAAYQVALQQMRGQGAGAVEALVAGYRAANPADYGTRALVVEMLAELELPEALPALIEIARTPVPRPTTDRDDVLSPFVEESIIRMSAVRGVGTFATRDPRARETLLVLLDSDAAPVREEAARALWAASARMEPAQREAIRARIPVQMRVDPERKLGPVGPQGANPSLVPRTGKRPS